VVVDAHVRRSAEIRKHLGAYYTPPALAAFLAQWILEAEPLRILEPSVGTGDFLIAVRSQLREGASHPHVIAVDIDSDAIDKASAFVDESVSASFHVRDFFELEPSDIQPVDAVLGNPPWIRFHHFTGRQRELAIASAAKVGVSLSGLSSSWAPFLVHSTRFLKETGRLAMVLPAELLRVDYARPVREYLIRRFKSIDVLAFDRPVFPGAQVDALLLLASNDGEAGLRISRHRDDSDLATFGERATPQSGTRWTEETSTRALGVLAELEARGSFVPLGTLGHVDIGVVTGHNKYFVLDDRTARTFKISEQHLRPIVTRSRQLDLGAVTRQTLANDARRGHATRLLTVDRHDVNPPNSYLKVGIAANVPNRYKCRSRHPWYSVPLVSAPDLFLAYMSQDTPRMAANVAGALSTNLIHGVYLEDPELGSSLVTAWRNAVTALSCELVGRSYGGGVLKLETTEAERVLVPVPRAGRIELTTAEARVVTLELARRRRSRHQKSRGLSRRAGV
jgi:adenine-specific DNA-methyltransferase